MAGRSWRDLQPKPARRTPTEPTISAPHSGAEGSPGRERLLEEAASGSPKLARLLTQRRQLEDRMRSLQSGGADLDARDAARFRVAGFSTRRAEERELQHRRDAQRESALRRRQAPPPPTRYSSADSRKKLGIPGSSEAGTPPRSSLHNRTPAEGGNSIGEWLQRRDTERQQLRDAARDRLAPLEKIGEAAGRARQSLGGGRLDELDKRLAAEDSSYERGSIQRELGSQLAPADKVLGRIQKAASAPTRAVDRIDDAWTKRRDRIEGPMDRIGPYVDLRDRRLSVDQGGSGDLFARMERNRQRGLSRLRERREQEVQDERRRERAQRSRKEKQAENR